MKMFIMASPRLLKWMLVALPESKRASRAIIGAAGLPGGTINWRRGWCRKSSSAECNSSPRPGNREVKSNQVKVYSSRRHISHVQRQ